MALKLVEIEIISDKIVSNIMKEGFLKLNKDISVLRSIVRDVLIEDMENERSIDRITKDILGQFSKEIEDERADSSRLFAMAKRKVAKREGFLL